jgi:hypothetical protein
MLFLKRIPDARMTDKSDILPQFIVSKCAQGRKRKYRDKTFEKV